MAKPKIRFKGYTNDWEQRSLGEFIKNVAKKNKENLDLEPYAVTNDRGFIAQRDAHDDFGYMSNVDRTAYNIVPPNSFAYNPARINVGSLGYYAGRENVIVSSLYEVFQTEKKIDDKFLWHWLRSDAFPKWIEKLQEGSVRLYFYYDKLIQCQMMVSTTEEQKKIGEYLDSLDHLITLHQRKCDQAKKLKKYMLQKMFPKNNKSVPEIRFEGFSNDWEQRKWMNSVDISTEMVDPASGEYDDMPHIAPGNIESFTGRILDNVRTVKEEQLISGKFRFRPDDVVYGKINPQLGKYFYSSVDGLTSADAYVFKGKNGITQKFLFSVLQTSDFFKYSVSVSKRSGMPKINRDELNAYAFLAPSEEEQDKIGTFLLKIDNLITLHQKKCDQLKNLKKFMLQNMFV